MLYVSYNKSWEKEKLWLGYAYVSKFTGFWGHWFVVMYWCIINDHQTYWLQLLPLPVLCTTELSSVVLTCGLSCGRWSYSQLKPWLVSCPVTPSDDWHWMLALGWKRRCSCSLACLHKGSRCDLGFYSMIGGFSEEEFQEQAFQKNQAGDTMIHMTQP